jgi:hypothetical protein
MTITVPIGISQFPQLREQGSYYVDKTAFIGEVLRDGSQALLFPRPRRFGKTLNLSTLRTFVERSDTDASPLFEDLVIWGDAEARKHFQRYPVIYLTLKDTTAGSWQQMFAMIRGVIANEVKRHRALRDAPGILPEDTDRLGRLMREADDPALFAGTLRDLSSLLAAHYGERVVVLIDEYDVPIQSAYAGGFFDEALPFFRSFLSGGLKDNPHLFKAVLTGVLRIAKESIFSGLNNVDVHSVLDTRYATTFGFTQPEVDKLARDLGLPEVRDELQRWYDGYRFGGHTIYNPWSVVSYVSRRDQGFRPYWVFTGADDVLRSLVLEKGHAMTRELEALIRGESITHVVTEHVVLRELDTNPDAVWSLLLMSGYLTARTVTLLEGRIHAELAIPNAETRIVFEDGISTWIRSSLAGGSRDVELLARAMLEGDERTFGTLLSRLVLRTLSFHDTGGREPERVYQAFVLGMLVHLADFWRVESNRESGLGRFDVAVIPKEPGRVGVVLELKTLDEIGDEPVEQALTSAIEQIRVRRYGELLEAAGADPILTYGVVFDGKRVWVRKAPDNEG